MDMHRNTYYDLIHYGIKELVIDRIGHFSEVEYHQYLGLITGKESCISMTNEELLITVANLKSEGYLEDMKHGIPQLEPSSWER
ncbi:hypothetical protein [Vibrio aestuarianus]|uniref:Mu-like prophage protein gp16 n=1 Tax=Vibrio aestuarianus TaxID=28171 RepID=A0A9X4ISK6_9VIBR|nr:hypothetical protein [Vibrio aestuarianus]MDE1242143.1 hypothetical protein [Vibrio aestuarianus]MDE1264648.1 hypothetical protein [Vibrio aestuarianus]MDE1296535.1 hypothetical protein [Vibrio aestuarianus]